MAGVGGLVGINEATLLNNLQEGRAVDIAKLVKADRLLQALKVAQPQQRLFDGLIRLALVQGLQQHIGGIETNHRGAIDRGFKTRFFYEYRLNLNIFLK